MNVSPIVFDIETAGLPDAAKYLEPVEPDKRLTDPIKIKASITEKEAARNERLGLDWNVGRIVSIGWWTDDTDVECQSCVNDEREAWLLDQFWQLARHRTIVGFRCKDFDLKFAIQRSRYLGVPHPQLDLGRYSRGVAIVDLYHELTFNDSQDRDSWCMRRTLHSFCKRFGIPVDDRIVGADIGALVVAGDWEAVVAHNRSDVLLTLALARRLCVVPPATDDEPAGEGRDVFERAMSLKYPVQA